MLASQPLTPHSAAETLSRSENYRTRSPGYLRYPVCATLHSSQRKVSTRSYPGQRPVWGKQGCSLGSMEGAPSRSESPGRSKL